VLEERVVLVEPDDLVVVELLEVRVVVLEELLVLGVR
jgi:hypothetical protein